MELIDDLRKRLNWRITTAISMIRIKLEQRLVKFGLCKDALETYQMGFLQGYEAGCKDTENQMRKKKRYVRNGK